MAVLGVQMMMLKNQVAEQGMYPALERLAALGIDAVEVSQIPVDEANTAALERGTREFGPTCTCLVPYHARRYLQPGPLTQRPSHVRGLLLQLGRGYGEPEEAGTDVATQAGRFSGSQPISAGALGLLGACGSPKRGAPGRREPGRHPQVDVRHDLEAVIIRRH